MNLFFWRKPQGVTTTSQLIDQLEIEIAGLEARRNGIMKILAISERFPARFADEAANCAERAARMRAQLEQLKRPKAAAVLGDWR